MTYKSVYHSRLELHDIWFYQSFPPEINSLFRCFGSSAAIIHAALRANHALFFDNNLCSYYLFQWLWSSSIYATSTIRLNKLFGPKLPNDKERKVKENGSSEECVSKDGIVVMRKYDSKPVLWDTNFVGMGTEDPIPRTEVMKRYSSSMEGLDKHEFLLSM